MADSAGRPSPHPARTGLLGRCPRCGEGRLFDGFLKLAPRCEVCRLDFDFADSADGPAVFVILLVGLLVAGAALVVEIGYAPPMWVHAALWLPLVLVLSLGLLRPLKGLMVALQYANKAQEGGIDRTV